MFPKATVSHVENTANRSYDGINKTTFFFCFDNNEGKQKLTKLLNCLHTGLVELLHAMSICENYDICKKKKLVPKASRIDRYFIEAVTCILPEEVRLSCCQ